MTVFGQRHVVHCEICDAPDGTIMTMSKMMMPTIRHMRIFMSFHHICLRTRLAPLRKPWAEVARLSVLSWSESRRAPRSDTLLMLSRMIPTVLSISCYRIMSATLFVACTCKGWLQGPAKAMRWRSQRGWPTTEAHGLRAGRGWCLQRMPAVRDLARARCRRTSAALAKAELSQCASSDYTMTTYRLKGRSAVVPALALSASLGSIAAGGNIRVVGLFAVGHGDDG
jgi:hypothetical protein